MSLYNKSSCLFQRHVSLPKMLCYPSTNSRSNAWPADLGPEAFKTLTSNGISCVQSFIYVKTLRLAGTGGGGGFFARDGGGGGGALLFLLVTGVSIPLP